MDLYRKAYLLLFNAITDALREKDIRTVERLLLQAQRAAEEIFMNDEAY